MSRPSAVLTLLLAVCLGLLPVVQGLFAHGEVAMPVTSAAETPAMALASPAHCHSAAEPQRPAPAPETTHCDCGGHCLMAGCAATALALPAAAPSPLYATSALRLALGEALALPRKAHRFPLIRPPRRR